jgi:hypothetical protein
MIQSFDGSLAAFSRTTHTSLAASDGVVRDSVVYKVSRGRCRSLA